MALAGVELETLVSEPDAVTTRPPPCTDFFFYYNNKQRYNKTNRSIFITKKSRIQ